MKARRERIMTTTNHIRGGFAAVRPYIHGKVGTLDFLGRVFGATLLEKHDFGPDKFHAEVKIFDSVLVLEEGELPRGYESWTSTIYVYVEDVNKTHALALKQGAKNVQEPEDKPYKERQACFKDTSGNTWWIATLVA